MTLLRERLQAVRASHGDDMPPELGTRGPAGTTAKPTRTALDHRTRLAGTPSPMHTWPGAGDVRLAGDAWGDPANPLVLLLHGAGQTRHAWGSTARMLGAAGYHAVAVDARGHGDSDWALDGDYSEGALVQDLQCLTAALGGKRPILMGASMGGSTSLVAVGESHVDASALVLVDIAPRTEASGVAKVRAFMNQHSAGFDSLEEVAAAIDTYRPRQDMPRNLHGLAKNVRLGSDGKFHWHWDPRILTRLRATHERRVESARRLALPTLLVRGGRSDVISEESVRDFLTLCPHADHVSIAGAGHMVAGDRNDLFGRAALDFLRRMVPPGARRPPAGTSDLSPPRQPSTHDATT